MTREEAVDIVLAWCPNCNGTGKYLQRVPAHMVGTGTALHWVEAYDEDRKCWQCSTIRKALLDGKS